MSDNTSITNIAVFNSPTFVELQSGLVEIALQHPDAHAAIVAPIQAEAKAAIEKGIKAAQHLS